MQDSEHSRAEKGWEGVASGLCLCFSFYVPAYPPRVPASLVFIVLFSFGVILSVLGLRRPGRFNRIVSGVSLALFIALGLATVLRFISGPV
jgi:amino acid transporter